MSANEVFPTALAKHAGASSELLAARTIVKPRRDETLGAVRVAVHEANRGYVAHRVREMSDCSSDQKKSKRS